MLLSVSSTNPKFSFVIAKNPATGMLAKSVRLGSAFGWFSKKDPQKYCLYFQDADNEVSYKRWADEKFEYLNWTRYNSSMCAQNLLSNFLSSATKVENENDKEGFENRVDFNMLYLHNERTIDFFNKNYEKFVVQAEPVSAGSYRVAITTQSSLRELLNFASLFLLVNTLRSQYEYFDSSDSAIEKYMKCLDVSSAPYNVVNIFKVNLLRNRKTFKKYKEHLEKIVPHPLELTFGNNDMARHEAISSRLDYQNPVLEIGCGEGNYTLKYAKKLEGQYRDWVSVDTDEECREIVAGKAKTRNLDNVTVLEHLDHFYDKFPPDDKKWTVLLVEVIEHMSEEEALKLIERVCYTPVFKKIIITTPNRSANKYYMIDSGEFRHDDHHFEWTFEEFSEKIHEVTYKTTDSGIRREFFGIGDKINGHHSTNAVEITRLT